MVASSPYADSSGYYYAATASQASPAVGAPADGLGASLFAAANRADSPASGQYTLGLRSPALSGRSLAEVFSEDAAGSGSSSPPAGDANPSGGDPARRSASRLSASENETGAGETVSNTAEGPAGDSGPGGDLAAALGGLALAGEQSAATGAGANDAGAGDAMPSASPPPAGAPSSAPPPPAGAPPSAASLRRGVLPRPSDSSRRRARGVHHQHQAWAAGPRGWPPPPQTEEQRQQQHAAMLAGGYIAAASGGGYPGAPHGVPVGVPMNPAMAMQHQHAHAAMLYAQQHGVPPPGVAFQGVPAPRGGGGGAADGVRRPDVLLPNGGGER